MIVFVLCHCQALYWISSSHSEKYSSFLADASIANTVKASLSISGVLILAKFSDIIRKFYVIIIKGCL